MKVNRSLRPDHGPALSGRDLISFEHSIKDEISRFLGFDSYSLYFPDYLDANSGVWQELSQGRAVHLHEERSLLLPLTHRGQLLGIFVARGVKLKAPKTQPPLIAEMAGLVLDKLALYKASITDRVTGLANRDRLMARAAEEIELVRHCTLPGSGTSMDPDSSCYSAGFGLIYVRLDGLSRIYERHGHELGDKAVSEAARVFLSHCPDRALSARPIPDSLAMLLPGGTPRLCKEISGALACDLAQVLVSDPIMEHSLGLFPSFGYAVYPQDLDGGASLTHAADQAHLIMRRAQRAALVAAEHGSGLVFSHEDVKARGGRIVEILRGGRVRVSLGREAGAAEGERYLVKSGPETAENSGNGIKGEIVLLEAAEKDSLAEVVHTSEPWGAPEIGDPLLLVRSRDTDEFPAAAGAEPRINESTGLFSYSDFMKRLAGRREIPDKFALYLTSLPMPSDEADDQTIKQAAAKAGEILGPDSAGGRFSLAGMIHFVPGVDRRKAKVLGLSLHKALKNGFGRGEPVIGMSTHPYLSFLPADAVENCRKALEYARLLDPPRVGLLDSLALTIAADKLFTEGRLFDAIEEYKLALIADKNNILARNSLGVSLARAGRLSEAARHFKMIIKRDETDVNARYNYGYACMRMGKDKEAESAFLGCLEINAGHVYSLIRLGQIALADGRFDEAEKLLQKAETLENGKGLTSRHMARLELARGRNDEAREHLHQAMIHDPGDALAMHLMAELYLQEGEDPQIAEALARQSAAIRPEHKPFLKTLALALDAQGRNEEAAAVRARAGSL